MKNLAFLLLAFMIGFAGTAFATVIPDYISNAVADSARPAGDTARDALRKPAETLAFAGVKPGMKIAEFYPGGGYFTRMISDIVGPGGHIYGIGVAKWEEKVDRKMAAEPGRGNVSLQFPAFGAFSLPEKVDLVWISQNYHDLHIAKYGHVDMSDFNKQVYDSLKPGGIYFITDHQGNPGMTLAKIAKMHRIPKAQVIREVEAAGFKLVGEDDALHNPADDHSKTIFDKAIQGHTDRYMLKFVKP